MYYLSTYTYIEQLKHKKKLGFKYNEIEQIIMIFYLCNYANKIIEWLKTKEFKNIVKNIRRKYEKN